MNPLEWLSLIYGKVFLGNPGLGYFVFAACGALAGAGLFFLAVLHYEKESLPKADSVQVAQKETKSPPGLPSAQPEKPIKERSKVPPTPEPNISIQQHNTSGTNVIGGTVTINPSTNPLTPSFLFSEAELIVLKNALEAGRGKSIMVTTIGGTESAALSSQIKDAFRAAGWIVGQGFIGNFNAVVVGAEGGSKIEVKGLHLITKENLPEISLVVSAFEKARHPVSLNGSTVLFSKAPITLFVAQ